MQNDSTILKNHAFKNTIFKTLEKYLVKMTSLIAIASFGKGTWVALIDLIKSAEWENIFIITDKFGINHFQKQERIEFVEVDFSQSPEEIRDKVLLGLKDKIQDFEVAFNMISGDGKTHMAVLSGILSLGLGIRLVYSKDNKPCEL